MRFEFLLRPSCNIIGLFLHEQHLCGGVLGGKGGKVTNTVILYHVKGFETNFRRAGVEFWVLGPCLVAHTHTLGGKGGKVTNTVIFYHVNGFETNFRRAGVEF